MSMNRLRNVAVRIRPLVSTVAPVPEASPDPSTHSRLPNPRRVVGDQAQAAGKRQIWDIEGDHGEDASPRDAWSTLTEPHQKVPAREAVQPVLPPEPSAPAGGRSKTRILGFHAQALEENLLDRRTSARTGPQFPAGFLVVVDGPGRGAFFAVTTSVSTIGRGLDQDVALDFGDESISREGHASVVYDEEQNRFFLGHGNKANVVRRNGTPVLATEELSHGDTIRIGKTTLRFHAFCGEDFTWTEPAQASGKAGRDE